MDNENNVFDSFGGQGDTPRGTPSRSDMRIIEQAVRRGWTIPDVVMDALPSKVANIFQTDKNTRNRLTAAKILLNMQSENRETARALMQYHGMIDPAGEAGLKVNHEVVVNQAMTEDEIRSVIDEYRKLHASAESDTEATVLSPQTEQ